MKRLIITPFICMILFFSMSIVTEATYTTQWDLTSYPDGIVAPEHIHIWYKSFDDNYHWDTCSVCNTTTAKVSHTLVSNGGSKTCYTNYYGGVQQEVCTCGYRSKLQLIVMGRYENYKSTHRLNQYYASVNSLDDIQQITKEEYNSISYPVRAQGYTWEDPDGDGYGWVFAGGPVIGEPALGIKGTIELILGREGDFGHNNSNSRFIEYYEIAEYCETDSTPTLAEFIQRLKPKSQLQSTSALYGLREKYQSVTNNQFNKITKEFKDVFVHPSNWGWGAMCLCTREYNVPGYAFYSLGANGGCHNQYSGYLSYYGKGGTCDICGTVIRGDEPWTSYDWHVCDVAYKIKDGETLTCRGASFVYGSNDNIVCTVYCTMKRSNGVTQVQRRIVCKSGWYITGDNVTRQPDGSYLTPWKIANTYDTDHIAFYEYTSNVIVTNGTQSRGLGLGHYYILPDCTPPTAYSISNASYWKVTGNGTASAPSTQAKITCTFYDPLDYSYNMVYARILDSDKKTPILQANGSEWIGMNKLSNTLWTGTLDVRTDVKGSKYVYIQTKDSTGNLSVLTPIQVSWLDGAPPTMSLSTYNNTSTWSKTKTVIASCSDSFDIARVGLTKSDMTELSKYNCEKEYTMIGDVYKDKTVRIYTTDGAGNLAWKDVVIGKLDNTRPTITQITNNVSAGKMLLTVDANDINSKLNASGSGVNGYAITTSAVAPELTEFQNSNKLTVIKNGTYYVWAKDAVGNISAPYEVKVIALTIDFKDGKFNGDTSSKVILDTVYGSKTTHTFNIKQYYGALNGNDYNSKGLNTNLTKTDSNGIQYRFLGYSLNPNATIPDTEFDVYAVATRTENYTIKDNTTLYAVWEPVLQMTVQLSAPSNPEAIVLTNDVPVNTALGNFKILGGIKNTDLLSSGTASVNSATIGVNVANMDLVIYTVTAKGASSIKFSTAADSRILDIYNHGKNNPWFDNLNEVKDFDYDIDNFSSTTSSFTIPQYLGTTQSYQTSNPDLASGTAVYGIKFTCTQPSYYYNKYWHSDESVNIYCVLFLNATNPDSGDDDGLPPYAVEDGMYDFQTILN